MNQKVVFEQRPIELDANEVLKEISVKVAIVGMPLVELRMKLFLVIMRFAMWVGGFGGIEFTRTEEECDTQESEGNPWKGVLEEAARDNVQAVRDIPKQLAEQAGEQK